MKIDTKLSQKFGYRFANSMQIIVVTKSEGKVTAYGSCNELVNITVCFYIGPSPAKNDS